MGIISSVYGAAVAPAALALACDPHRQQLFLQFVTLVFVASEVGMIFLAEEASRLALLGIHGLVAWGAAVTMLLLHDSDAVGYSDAVIELCTGYAVVVLSAAFVFFPQVPERWRPGGFDRFNSHAIWHLNLIVAVYLHSYGVLRLYDALAAETLSCWDPDPAGAAAATAAFGIGRAEPLRAQDE